LEKVSGQPSDAHNATAREKLEGNRTDLLRVS
jgi:hypothetical protein